MAALSSNWFLLLKRRGKKNLTEAQKDMVEWNNEKWTNLTTEGGRYAPQAVKDSLTPEQRRYESKKKREGTRKGKQNVPRGKTAKKVYRRIEGR